VGEGLQRILDHLRDCQYRLTPQRRLIVETLLDYSQDHLSAEDLYRIVKRRDPAIGLATVYRTLDLLASLAVLTKVNFGDGCSRFELSAAKRYHHHHHLICEACGVVQGFDEDLLGGLERTIERRTGFRVHDHEVKFYGICHQCRQAAEG
jgi:Fur family ferric uptake transcriptional regulator